MSMWSQLANTPVGQIAKRKMDANGCEYHNWNHVMSMFRYLSAEGYPYSPALDLAILYHDVIYDAKPRKEDRSAEFLMAASEKAPKVFEGLDIDKAMYLIYDTIEHRIGSAVTEDSKAIIRADLHQLADGKSAYENFNQILNESLKLYRCTVDEFARNNDVFMCNLRTRVLNNFNIDTGYQKFWSDVIDGIDETRHLARMVSRKPQYTQYKKT